MVHEADGRVNSQKKINDLILWIDSVFGPTKRKDIKVLNTLNGPITITDKREVSDGQFTIKLVSSQSEIDAHYEMRRKVFSKSSSLTAMTLKDDHDNSALHFLSEDTLTKKPKGSARLIIKEDARDLPSLRATQQYAVLPGKSFLEAFALASHEQEDALSALPVTYESSRVVADITSEKDYNLYNLTCLAMILLANPERTEDPAYVLALQTRALTEKSEKLGYFVENKGADVEYYGPRVPLVFNTFDCYNNIQDSSKVEKLKKVWQRNVLGQWSPLEPQPRITLTDFFTGDAFTTIFEILGKGDPHRVKLKDFSTRSPRDVFSQALQDIKRRNNESRSFESEVLRFSFADIMQMAEFNAATTRFYDRGTQEWRISCNGGAFVSSEPPKGRTHAPPPFSGFEAALDRASNTQADKISGVTHAPK